MRLGMVIDLRKCIGCHACTVACKSANLLPAGVAWNKVYDYEIGEYPNVVRRFLPMLCMHCKDALCVKVCPAGSTEQRKDGIVWIDEDKCVGCRYCVIACPYQQRTFHWRDKMYFPGRAPTEFEKSSEQIYSYQKGVVWKCHFCIDRIDDGLAKGLKPGVDPEATPACVEACMTQARYFGDLDYPDSEVSRMIRENRGTQLHPEYGTDPSIYYVGY